MPTNGSPIFGGLLAMLTRNLLLFPPKAAALRSGMRPKWQPPRGGRGYSTNAKIITQGVFI